MQHQSLKERLMKYMLRRHTSWIASGDLQRIVAKYTSYTPRTVVRRLEELAATGRLEVEYRRGHAFYRPKQENRATGQITPNPAKESHNRAYYVRQGQEAVEAFDRI